MIVARPDWGKKNRRVTRPIGACHLILCLSPGR